MNSWKCKNFWSASFECSSSELKFNKLHLREDVTPESVGEFHTFLYMTEGMSRIFTYKNTFHFHSNRTLAFTNMKCFLLIQENIPD